MNQRNPAMKWIASAVVFTFLITSFGVTPNTFAATGVPAPEVSSLTAGMLAIPAELGQVTDTVTGDPKAPAFIHIQSAHGNYQAEKNIEKLLGYIEKNSSVKLMLLEGAAEKLQPELFRLFPQYPDFNRKVTDKLMQEGYLTGPESFLINQKAYGVRSTGYGETKEQNAVRRTQDAVPFEAFGAENLDAYKKDREAFISVVKQEKTAEKYIASLRASIDKRFSAKLNKDLLNLVRQEEAFGSGTVSFESWIKTLGEGSKKHLKQDLADAFYQDQYPFLIRYFRLQAIGSEIDREKAIGEKELFLRELEKRGIAKEIAGLFKKGLGTRDSGIDKTRSQNESRGTSYESRSQSGYSPLRHAFDAAFDKLPKDFSMTQWPHWTLYAQYAILMQEMEGKGLQEETVRLKERIQAALAQTSDDKEYLAATRQLYLLRRLFNLELTRGEYEELLMQRDSYLGTRASQGTKTNPKSLVPNPEAKALFASAMDFYSTAVVREQHMFTNALQKMGDAKQQRAVIVTGGFHAEGLRKLAASKNYSYIQITPRIAEVTKRDHEVYLRSILGSRDIETSQMIALLGIVNRAQRVAVTGVAATQVWFQDVRGIVQPMINSEDASVRLALSAALSASFLAPSSVRTEVRQQQPTADSLSPAVAGLQSEKSRSEVRLTDAQEKQFQKAMYDLPPKWWDVSWFNQSGVERRIAAIKTLGELKDPRVVSALAATFSDPNKDIRLSTAKALGLVGALALPALFEALQDEEYTVREAAAKALIAIGTPDVASLIKVLRNKDYDIRAAAISALQKLYALSELGKELNNEYPDVRAAAAQALGELKDFNAVPVLIEALKDTVWHVRQSAAKALSDIKDPRAVPAWIQALKDENSNVRAAAIAALRELKALSALGRELNNEHRDVRAAAIAALRELKALSELGKELNNKYPDVRLAALLFLKDTMAGSELAAVLKDDDPNVRSIAIATLYKPHASSELGKELHNEYWDVRTAAALALGELKDTNAVPGLIKTLEDVNWSVRAAAATALEKIGDPRSAPALSEYEVRAHREREERLAREREASSSGSSDDDQEARFGETPGHSSTYTNYSRSEARLTDAQEKQFQKDQPTAIGLQPTAKTVTGVFGLPSAASGLQFGKNRSETRTQVSTNAKEPVGPTQAFQEAGNVPDIAVSEDGNLSLADSRRLQEAVTGYFKRVESTPDHRPLNYLYDDQHEQVDIGGGLFSDLVLNTGRQKYVERTLRAAGTQIQTTEYPPDVMMGHAVPAGATKCFLCNIEKIRFIARMRFRGDDYLLVNNGNPHGPESMLLTSVKPEPQRLSGEFLTLFAGCVKALGDAYEGSYSEPFVAASVYHRHGQIRKLKVSILRNKEEALGLKLVREMRGISISEVSQWPATAYSFDGSDLKALGEIFDKVLGKFHAENIASNINMHFLDGKFRVIQYPRITGREKPKSLCPEKPDSYGRFGGLEIGGWLIFLGNDGFDFMKNLYKTDLPEFRRRIRAALSETSIPRAEASKILLSALADDRKPASSVVRAEARAEGDRDVLSAAAQASVLSAAAIAIDAVTAPQVKPVLARAEMRNKTFIPLADLRSAGQKKPVNFPLVHRGTAEDPLKIVLVMPRAHSQGEEKPTRFPVGLMSLASCLRDKEFLLKLANKIPGLNYENPEAIPNIDVRIVDLQAEPENFDLETYLQGMNPDMVGISAVSQLFSAAGEVSKKAAKAVPQAIRVIGGVHISAISENNYSQFEMPWTTMDSRSRL
jgi:HEAT repeat protein